MGYSILRHSGNALKEELIFESKGNEVNIPQASRVAVWQHIQSRRRQYVPPEEFSFLFN